MRGVEPARGRGDLWLRNAATVAGSAPLLIAHVATEWRNRPGVNGEIPSALHAAVTAIP